MAGKTGKDLAICQNGTFDPLRKSPLKCADVRCGSQARLPSGSWRYRRGLRHARKFLAPEQRHEAPFPFDQAATPKLLCGAVEVHKRKAASIRENLPSERKAKLIIAQKAYSQLRVQLPRNG